MFSIQCNKDSASQQKCSDTLNVCFCRVFSIQFFFKHKHKPIEFDTRVSAAVCAVKEMHRPGTRIPPARVPRWQSLSHAHINTNPALWQPLQPPETSPGQGAQLCQVLEEIQSKLWAADAAVVTEHTWGWWMHRNSNRLKWYGPENKSLSFQVKTWIWRNIYTYYYANVTAALWVAVLLFFSQLLTKRVCINSLRLAKF